MQGFETSYDLNTISVARVIAQQPESYSVMVQLPSWQFVAFPVKVLTYGPNDAYRMEQRPLPLPGTWGIVIFPYGDNRNGIWLGSYAPSYVDAITSSNATLDANIDYSAHYSGDYTFLDGSGNRFLHLADGSSIIAGSSLTPPTLYRHIIGSDGTQQRIPFVDTDRNVSSINPFYLEVNHISGASVGIDNTGAIIAKSANDSGTTIEMDSGGNVNVTGSAQAVATVNMPGGVILESANTVELISGSATFQVTQGQIIANPPIIATVSAQLSSIT